MHRLPSDSAGESGNMLIYILGAIVLLGLLIIFVRGSSTPGAGIDDEQISLKVSQVQQYAGELERAVAFIIRNGHSENDIRFAHPDAPSAYGLITDTPTRQVFDVKGGGATYRQPPGQINDGTLWQFYATTHIKDMGTDSTPRAELIAVLPNVTTSFCSKINELNDQNLTLTADLDPAANGCIFAGSGNEFTGTFTSGGGTNTIDHTLFSHLPPTEACIRCQSDNKLHYYHVLLSR